MADKNMTPAESQRILEYVQKPKALLTFITGGGNGNFRHYLLPLFTQTEMDKFWKWYNLMKGQRSVGVPRPREVGDADE